ncbi:binding-protein-dependent transport systems inner membrane component [Beutenbergia cavernae DSM 12333]|uniref:Binding-protein-dependent transport systems inner membrane component n=1 Tax=Beutenbergia cavernae (strain ATCC BAA-8 / DSM 12333 / CCUG 43141 / JCM 11478 / NBRC 16432 / NCIMB 13614 / HKI 0122) TaxID=471853 RepID=C5BUT1_BEUC1|nr:ABC transporter permease [Beutenbergia cavernae]ACQ78305.1 binding-protein-dependent transport systems inner membrane component [Beutenbergia cavernae DSM 12333]
MRYLLQKLGFYVIALWAALTLNFFLPRWMPGNPVDILVSKLAQRGEVTPATRQAIALLLGMDEEKPLWEQYIGYLQQVFSGDLGVSVAFFPTPVSEVIAQTIPWTIGLVGISTLLSFILGVGLGMIAGWKRGSWIDNLIPATTLLQSVPYFWLALVLLFLFGSVWQIFPLYGGYDVTSTSPAFSWEFLSSIVYYGTLPALTIVVSSIGGWMLGMRNMMVSTMSEDYILTAEAKGLRSSRIRFTYAARNAVLPSVAGFAISLGFVVAGSVVTESVFSYPGIGSALISSVNNADYALMQGIFLVITLSVLGANLLVDLLYSVIDPRTRARA